MRRKRAVGEHGEARQRQPLGSADLRAGRGIAIGPLRSGAGVEQHADDGEVEVAPARARLRRRAWRGARRWRPSDPRRPPRNAASANGTARRGRDRPCAWSRRRGRRPRRAAPDRCGNAPAGPRARSPASDARAAAPRRRSKATWRQPCRASRASRSGLAGQFLSSERPTVSVKSCGFGLLRRVVAGGLLGRDLHMRVGRHQLVGKRNALDDLDALRRRSASYFMSLMETKRSMRVRPSQWITSGISCWKRASCTPATHSVRSK